MENNCIVRMLYANKLTHISCPVNTKYEEYLQIAMKHYLIPATFNNFIQLTSDDGYIFSKRSFEHYIRLYSKPKKTFKIILNYDQLLDDLCLDAMSTGGKRKSDDKDSWTPLQKYDCFIEPPPDEPRVKRFKIDSFC